MRRERSVQNGFTVAELLIVVAIIAVMVAIAIPVFVSQFNSAGAATCIANRRGLLAEVRVAALSTTETEADIFKHLHDENPDTPYTCPDNGTWTYDNGEITCSVEGHEPLGTGGSINPEDPSTGSMSSLFNAIVSIFDGSIAPKDARSNAQRTIHLQGNSVNGTPITELLDRAFGQQIFGSKYSNMLAAITREKSKPYTATGNPIQALVYQPKNSETHYLYFNSATYIISSYDDLKTTLGGGKGTAEEILSEYVKNSEKVTKVA